MWKIPKRINISQQVHPREAENEEALGLQGPGPSGARNVHGEETEDLSVGRRGAGRQGAGRRGAGRRGAGSLFASVVPKLLSRL